MKNISWQWGLNLDGWWLMAALLIFIGLCTYVVIAYWSDGKHMSTFQRTTGAALRICVFTALVFIAFSPEKISSETHVEPGTALIYLDTSASMEVEDLSSKTRIKQIVSTLKSNNYAFLKSLTQKHNVAFFAVDQTIRPLGVVKHESKTLKTQMAFLDNILPAKDTGFTNLSSLADHCIRQSQQQSVSAAILVSDGQHNTQGDAAASIQRLKAAGLILHTVGVGDETMPFNFRIASLNTPANVFKDEPIAITALVSMTGEGFQSVPIHLEAKGPGMSNYIVISKDVISVPVGGSIAHTFRHTPSQAGQWEYQVSVPIQIDEASTNDNNATALVDVTKDKIKVLLASGYAMWDYQLLRQRLRREQAIELSCYLQALQPGAIHENHVNSNMQSSEGWKNYDVIVALDLNPDLLPVDWGKTIIKQVKNKGVGLFWAPGDRYAQDFLHRYSQDLNEISPVTILKKDTAIIPASFEWQFPVSGQSHPAIRVEDTMENSKKIWQEIKIGRWPWGNITPKASAEVLLALALPKNPGKVPYLASHRLGTGYVMFLAQPATWQLRSQNVAYFDRFWLQSIRRLLEGSRANQARGLFLDQRNVEIGHRQGVTIRMPADTILPPTIMVASSGNITENVESRTLGGQSGVFRAEWVTKIPGLSRVSIQGLENQNPNYKKAFVVNRTLWELKDTRLNPSLLKAMATNADGEYMTLNDMASLAADLPEKTHRWTQSDPPMPAWDSPLILCALIGLLSLEWIFRRKWGLL